MKKETIEIFRGRSNFDYGYVIKPVSKQDYLNAIVKFSQKQEKEIIVYRHVERFEQENISETEFYEPLNDWTDKSSKKMGVKIPKCDSVYYLDIYYQEK